MSVRLLVQPGRMSNPSTGYSSSRWFLCPAGVLNVSMNASCTASSSARFSAGERPAITSMRVCGMRGLLLRGAAGSGGRRSGSTRTVGALPGRRRRGVGGRHGAPRDDDLDEGAVERGGRRRRRAVVGEHVGAAVGVLAVRVGGEPGAFLDGDAAG